MNSQHSGPKISNQVSLETYDYKKYPQTRFQGSKYRILDWIHFNLMDLDFHSVLDGFSGSGVVSYYFKSQSKVVTSNDLLKSSFLTAKGLIENSSTKLSEDFINEILVIPKYDDHNHVIEKYYENIYYTNSENIWLDGFIANLNLVEDDHTKAILYWALFQACIIKRPFNLFHRNNLSMRMRDVNRSFGNKKTWDRDFPYYIKKFINQANNAIFDSGKRHTSLNQDILSICPDDFDLVYLDPPYMKLNKNLSGNDYQNYYHFLEGILDYEKWGKSINHNLKHRPYHQEKTDWIKPNLMMTNFDNTFQLFEDSKIVVSYNTEGYPSVETLVEMLEGYKKKIKIHFKEIKYALKKEKKVNTEILIIAE